MRRTFLACLAAVSVLVPAAVTVSATTATASSGSARAAAPAPTDIRVATYNIVSVSVDTTRGEQRPWKQRRDRIITQIRKQGLDVVGVQEANPSRHWAPRLVDGPNQYLDLRNGLNRAGAAWQVTNTAAYNCVNATTSSRCVPQDQGASNASRILYNTRTIDLVSQGSYQYVAQGEGNRQFLAWAVLRTKASGREFLFVDTHIAPDAAAVRRAQIDELIAEVDRIKGDLPVIAVGDFNTQKFDPVAADMIPQMKAAGYGDTANQQYDTNNLRNPRPLRLVNRWINSCNHYSRNVASFGYEDQRDRIGNGIDWIFATNSLLVKEWKVNVLMNPRTLRMQGVIPSDHNMVEATIAMP